jgi:large subunit ribosomal protein L9
MKVLLRHDVSGVGRRGDLIDVADGFARNFLLPGGKAIIATDGVAVQAEAMRRARDLRDAQSREAAQAQARVLAGSTIDIAARAGQGGRLFGSIGIAEIIKAIEAQKSIVLDRHQVDLHEPIKDTGEHGVQVKLFEGVETTITIVVTASE